ncbi:MAG: TRAP transporter small permease [Candidatus Neomarinimicrobiota bacterium]
MNLSSRIPPYFKRLKWFEGTVATITFSIMALLPFIEAFTRIFGLLSIPASQVIVQHLTLWIGLIGAIFATRRNKLLALTQRPLFAAEEKFHLGRYIAKLMTFLVLIALAWGSWELVKVEMQYPMDIAPNIPRWVAMLIMPIGFALMSLQIF